MRRKHIGRVTNQRLDPIFRNIGPKRLVKRITDDRRVVNLEIACMHDTAFRTVDHQSRAFGDRMAYRQETHAERPRFHRLRPGLHGFHGPLGLPRLGHLSPRDIRGKYPRVHRRAQLLPIMPDRAHMVLMGMGDKNPLDAVLTGFQPRDIGEDQVHTGRPVHIWKRHTQIDNNQPFLIRCAVAIDIGIHPNLACPAEG